MPKRLANPKGVFCIEGDWWGHTSRQASVRPALELLRNWDPYYVPHMHWPVCTADSMEFYLRKWLLKKNRRLFPILYLALHGNGEEFTLAASQGKQHRYSFDELEDLLSQNPAACKRRVVFLGSCLFMDKHGRRLNRFLNRTGALAVCGYRDVVDWLESSTMDALALGTIQENALTRAGVRAVNTKIHERAGSLAKRLGFRMVVSKGA